ncbi:Rho GTPase activation protein [Phycomyces nitens]|nr:Rho GTPase activation protein [Phycomyces nitens]
MNPLLLLIRSKEFFYSNTYNSVQPKTMIKGIFGAPLEYAAMCGSTSFHSSLDLCVPSPVHRCFTEIIKRGLHFEGIFRLSGAASEVSRLQDAFDQPPTYGKYLDLTQYDIHSITSVVKKYLRNLPDSVIPMSFHDQFLQTTELCRSHIESINLIAALIADLPTAHNHLLHYVFILVSRIREHETVNKMNPEALATVLAPVCAGLEHTLKDLPAALKKKKTKVLMKSDMIGVVERNRRWTELWILMIENLDVLLCELKDQNHRASMQFTNQKGHLTVPSRPSPSMVRRPSSPTPYQALMQQFYVPVLSGDSLQSLHIGTISQESAAHHHNHNHHHLTSFERSFGSRLSSKGGCRSNDDLQCMDLCDTVVRPAIVIGNDQVPTNQVFPKDNNHNNGPPLLLPRRSPGLLKRFSSRVSLKPS